jgi:hypothetical protein
MMGKQLDIPSIVKDFSRYLDIPTERWYLGSMPKEVELNSYQPMGGQGSSDSRFGNPATNVNNENVKQNAQMGKTNQPVGI